MTVENRLERIEDRMTDLEVHQAEQKVMLEDIHSCIKPQEGPSFPVRLDRVERRQAGFIKVIWTVFITALTAVGGWVVTALKG
jgi:hypothetical protein